MVIALLDACVLYPAPMRDLLLNLADAGLFIPKWTDQIHDEWTRNLLFNRPDLLAVQLQKTTDAMNSAFPDATITNYETLISVIHLPDPDDGHVLAAAICGKAQVIVTANLKDFPKAYLSQYKVEPQHPDQFISKLIEANTMSALQAFNTQVANLKNPTKTPAEVLQTLRRVGLEQTVDRLSTLV